MERKRAEGRLKSLKNMKELSVSVKQNKIGAGREINFANNAGVVTDIFDKSNVDNEKLNKAIEKFYGGTSVTMVFDSLEKKLKPKAENHSVRGKGAASREKLINTGVIDPFGQIHRDKLTEFFKGTTAGKIRDLRIENPKIKEKEIAEKLNIDPSRVSHVNKDLIQSGLLEGKREEKNEAGINNNPVEKPHKIAVRSRVNVKSFTGMYQGAKELDNKVLELINNKSTLYEAEIVAELEGPVFASAIKRSIDRLAHEELLKLRTERIDGEKVTKVEKIDKPEKNKVEKKR